MIDSELTQFYEVQSVLGRGTAGVVLKAFDRQRKQLVAVKQFTRQEKSSADFFKELVVVNRLVHPHLVRVLHMFLGKAGNRYIIYEFMDRGSLRTRIKRKGPMTALQASQIVVDCCKGLQFAHEQELVHCDIKPENILAASREDSNRPEVWKLTDFGLAQNLLTRGPRPVSVGTPAYMAPEQFYDRPNPQSDLYSLGVVFYEMLVGDRPFKGDPQQICRAHNEQHPDIDAVPVAQYRPILQGLLAKRPEDRIQTPRELAELIAAVNENLLASGEIKALDAPSDEDSISVTLSRHDLSELSDVLSNHREATRLSHMEWHLNWDVDLANVPTQLRLARGESGSEVLVLQGSAATRYHVRSGEYFGRLVFDANAMIASNHRSSTVFVVAGGKLRQYDVGGDVVRSWPLPPNARGLSINRDATQVLIAYDDHVRYMDTISRSQWKLRLRNYNQQVPPLFTREGLVVCSEGPLEPAVVFLDQQGQRLRTVRLESPVSVMCTGEEDGLMWVASFGPKVPGRFSLEAVPLEGEPRELPFETPVVRAEVHDNVLISSELRQRVFLTDLTTGVRNELKVEGRLHDFIYDPRERLLVLVVSGNNGLQLLGYRLVRTKDAPPLADDEMAVEEPPANPRSSAAWGKIDDAPPPNRSTGSSAESVLADSRSGNHRGIVREPD